MDAYGIIFYQLHENIVIAEVQEPYCATKKKNKKNKNHSPYCCHVYIHLGKTIMNILFMKKK